MQGRIRNYHLSSCASALRSWSLQVSPEEPPGLRRISDSTCEGLVGSLGDLQVDQQPVSAAVWKTTHVEVGIGVIVLFETKGARLVRDTATSR